MSSWGLNFINIIAFLHMGYGANMNDLLKYHFRQFQSAIIL